MTDHDTRPFFLPFFSFLIFGYYFIASKSHFTIIHPLHHCHCHFFLRVSMHTSLWYNITLYTQSTPSSLFPFFCSFFSLIFLCQLPLPHPHPTIFCHPGTPFVSCYVPSRFRLANTPFVVLLSPTSSWTLARATVPVEGEWDKRGRRERLR
jgi:hypothetical protein